MANHDSTTTLDDADEREARVIEILASGVLDVLPENEDRAARVLRRAREKFEARQHRVPEPEHFRA